MSDADAKAIRNERSKLTCTALNNVGVAIIVTGAIVPLISWPFASISGQVAIRVTAIVWWAVIGVVIHLGALKLLARIRA